MPLNSITDCFTMLKTDPLIDIYMCMLFGKMMNGYWCPSLSLSLGKTHDYYDPSRYFFIKTYGSQPYFVTVVLYILHKSHSL